MNRPTRNTLFGCVLCLVLAGFWSCTAKAEFDSGNDIYLQCGKASRDDQLVCISKSIAYFDMMSAFGFECEQTKGVSGQQLRDIFVKYLRDRPATRNQAAATLAIFAYSSALACRAPKWAR